MNGWSLDVLEYPLDGGLDVSGWDAAHKAIILASLAYGTWINPAKVFVEGIEQVTARDVASELYRTGQRGDLTGTGRGGQAACQPRSGGTFLFPEASAPIEPYLKCSSIETWVSVSFSLKRQRA